MLDSLYDEYEGILNERLDNVDALISEMIDVINLNSANIGDTLARVSDEVGYTMTQGMKDIWSNDGAAHSIVSVYGDNFNSQLTSINQVLDAIQASISSMVSQEADEIGTADVSHSPTSSGSSVQDISPSNNSISENTSSNSEIDDIIKRKVAAAIWHGGLGWGKGKTRSQRLTEVFGANNGIQALINAGVGKNDKSSDIKNYSYSLMRKQFKGYRTGGLVDYTGLAMVDGTPRKPELMLNAQDTENFIELRNYIRELAKQKITLGSGYRHGNIRLNGLTDVSNMLAKVRDYSNYNSNSIRDVNIGINIDHVEDYNDFIYKMQHDKQFERMIEDMTVNRIAGGSSFAKYRHKW